MYALGARVANCDGLLALWCDARTQGKRFVDLQLVGKVVVITGGAKGIGAAIARTCVQEGAVPVVLDRDKDAGEQVASELRGAGAALRRRPQRASILARKSGPGGFSEISSERARRSSPSAKRSWAAGTGRRFCAP